MPSKNSGFHGLTKAITQLQMPTSLGQVKQPLACSFRDYACSTMLLPALALTVVGLLGIVAFTSLGRPAARLISATGFNLRRSEGPPQLPHFSNKKRRDHHD